MSLGGFAMSDNSSKDQKYTSYFSDYGAFLASWLYYEQLIELLIKRELNLAVRETSILCSAMNFGVKFNVLLALLRRTLSNEEGVKLLGSIQQISERNKIVHGFLLLQESQDIHLVTRDVKGGKYTVKTKKHDPQIHMSQFIDAFSSLQEWSGITDSDIHEYGQQIEADAKAHQSREDTRPEDSPSFGQPNYEPTPILPELNGE
jgi:hypothetical protein